MTARVAAFLNRVYAGSMEDSSPCVLLRHINHPRHDTEQYDQNSAKEAFVTDLNRFSEQSSGVP